MSRQKNILILTSSLGFGHMSAAKAIADAITDRYSDRVRATIINPIEHEQTTELLRDIHDMYDSSTKREGLYELLYKLSDTGLAAMATDTAVSVMLRDSVNSVIEQQQPDIIVSVHADFLAPLRSLYELTGYTYPIVTVITDLTTIHRRWFNPVSSATVVPTPAAYRIAKSYNMPESKIHQIGIPVSPIIANEQRPVAEIRAELGWDPDLTTILVVGSKRVANLTENLRGINHSALPIQLALIAGGDDKLHGEFRDTKWHVPVHIYNYVDNVPAMMKAADIIISKAGGLVVSETLASGRPMLITDVIEGQETGNADYVVENGAGERAFNPVDILETLYHWLMNDRDLLKLRAEKAAASGNPNAAYEIAALIMEKLPQTS